MTDVDTRASDADLSTLRVSQLQAIASELGIPGGSKLRKGELVTAISEIRAARGLSASTEETAPASDAPTEVADAPVEDAAPVEAPAAPVADAAPVEAPAAPVADAAPGSAERRGGAGWYD
ncbi:Rho termination factor N-terminal domain-containing protein [Clavibacter capsici]|uniref:Rho termination factor N-terminal domain-containing protein n=1 Tax=Clavibacter capsici TaxID=1874630 RepID=UPI00293F022A|nr:Rho termination factor N-terminal domain-containing protein [Clavibacter capsici]